jgi:hypothetical protein
MTDVAEAQPTDEAANQAGPAGSDRADHGVTRLGKASAAADTRPAHMPPVAKRRGSACHVDSGCQRPHHFGSCLCSHDPVRGSLHPAQ